MENPIPPGRKRRGRLPVNSELPVLMDPSGEGAPYVKVPISGGGFALVDAMDYPIVAPYRWNRSEPRTHGIFYATTSWNRDGRATTMPMHRLILGLDFGDPREGEHRNHDGLDNRRSCNLRIATKSQNRFNCRSSRKSIYSSYKGVSYNRQARKWVSQVEFRGKAVNLGHFDAEGEAAFAYMVAIEHLGDLKFVYTTPILDGDMPSPGRMEEIRVATLNRVHAILTGGKGKTDAASNYRGVSYDPVNTKWTAHANVGSKPIFVGRFDREGEAAFAVNVATRLIPKSRPHLNVITKDDLPADPRRSAIETTVSAKIRAYLSGHRGRLSRTSSYKCISFCRTASPGLAWLCQMYVRGTKHVLTWCGSEVEAVVAYNAAASILGDPRYEPYAVPSDRRPTAEVEAGIRERVAAKLATLLAKSYTTVIEKSLPVA